MARPVMGPLGFPSVCLKTGDLHRTVAFYRGLGFDPVGEDAPGVRVSLASGADTLTFMTFLDADIVNFRGAHIHRLMCQLEARGVAVTGFNEVPEEQPLELDPDGRPLPGNSCGHFTVNDPDGHELFFNTHPHERAPFEARLAGPIGTSPPPPLGSLVPCLEVTDLDASAAFYETLGLRARRARGGAWIVPPARHRSIHFVLELRESASAGFLLGFHGGRRDGWAAKGLTSTAAGWAGVDPDGRRLELLPDPAPLGASAAG